MQYIALLDCNNFFVSCERLFRPDLLGKPVVVLSSNDGCVVARSQEVKDIGIPMGIPVFKVKKEFKEANVVTFSSNFPLYRDISARVMGILREEVQQMEQYSVDEAFFAIPNDVDALTYVTDIKSLVEKKVGIPVSIGIGGSKTLAKVANSIAKKSNGSYVLETADWIDRSKNMHIGELWGVGAGMSQRFVRHDIRTPSDLLAADPARIAQLFGVVGTRLQNELSETPAYPLSGRRSVQESVMSSRSFAHTEHNMLTIEKAIAYHVEHVVSSVREMTALASVVHVHVRPSRFGDYALRGVSEAVQFEVPTDDTKLILKEVLKVFRKRFDAEVPYKKAGVTLSGLIAREGVTPDLFHSHEVEGEDELLSAVDSLRAKFGKDIVSLYGANTRTQLTARNFSSGGQTTRWCDIPTVKAS